MSDAGAEYLVTAFPNGTNGSSSTLKKLNKAVGGGDLAEVFAFELPLLKVGTLEKLISASDSLARTDSGVEALVRKIERTFTEVAQPGEELRVDGDTAHTYFTTKFKWDHTKYQASVRPIEDLIRLITQTSLKLDDELKSSLQNYQEIKHELSALQRKRGGNLMANVGEYCAKAPDQSVFVDTEFLTHVLVVVSRNVEEAFLAQYELLAGDAVGYGPASNRQQVLGSPVVPRSAVKVAEDSDGYVLYTVTVLKTFKDVYAQALTKARFTVRERYGGVGSGGGGSSKEEELNQAEERFTNLELDFQEVKLQLKRWTKIHYVEAFSCWLHVKMIRVFVEGVLMYGLPVDFLTTILYLPNRKQEKKLRQKLEKFFLEGSGEADLGLAGELSGAQKKETYYPYVSFNFRLVGGE